MKLKIKLFKNSLKLFLLIVVLVLPGCGTLNHSSSHDVKKLNEQHFKMMPVQNGYIEYYQFGVGAPIVLIPGYVTDVSSWDRHFLLNLAEKHQLIIINNRGVGRSYVHSTRYDTKELANDTVQLIQALQLKKPAILGISMGGMIAQQLAVLHPEQVGQLILINTAIAGKQSVHPPAKIEEKMFNFPKNIFGRYTVAVELFFPPKWRAQMALALAIDRFQPKDYKEIDPKLIERKQQHLVLDWANDDFTAMKLKKLNMPVLILNGESDAVIPPINSVILSNAIPNTSLVRWKEGGHAMIYQYPKPIAETINYFIDETT